MHLLSQSSASHRLFKVLVAAVAIPLIALAPALLASLLLTHDTVDPAEPTEHAATIDVSDVDPEATVMYAVSPLGGDRYDSDVDFIVPSDFEDTLRDEDVIKFTVIDKGTHSTTHRFVDPEMEDGCRIKLHLSSDDQHDERTGTYEGYLRIVYDDTLTATYTYPEQLENCGIYVIHTD